MKYILLVAVLLSSGAFAEDKYFFRCECKEQIHNNLPPIGYYKGKCQDEDRKIISVIVDKKNKKMSGNAGRMQNYTETETEWKAVLLNHPSFYGEFTSILNRITRKLTIFDNWDENYRGVISESSKMFGLYNYRCSLVDRL